MPSHSYRHKKNSLSGSESQAGLDQLPRSSVLVFLSVQNNVTRCTKMPQRVETGQMRGFRPDAVPVRRGKLTRLLRKSNPRTLEGHPDNSGGSRFGKKPKKPWKCD